MSEPKDDKPSERPHGHRDRGEIEEGSHKDDADSSKRTQGPDALNPEGDDTDSYPKGR